MSLRYSADYRRSRLRFPFSARHNLLRETSQPSSITLFASQLASMCFLFRVYFPSKNSIQVLREHNLIVPEDLFSDPYEYKKPEKSSKRPNYTRSTTGSRERNRFKFYIPDILASPFPFSCRLFLTVHCNGESLNTSSFVLLRHNFRLYPLFGHPHLISIDVWWFFSIQY